MNDTQTPVSAPDSNLEWQVAALQRQVFLLLLALIVVTATLVFYLFYQSHIFGADLNRIRPQASQIIQAYQQHALAIENFDKQLSSYGTRNPAFQPVLKKYGWSPTSAPRK
jgi:hypothetical protein